VRACGLIDRSVITEDREYRPPPRTCVIFPPFFAGMVAAIARLPAGITEWIRTVTPRTCLRGINFRAAGCPCLPLEPLRQS